jgi:hypothetical protein
MSNQYQQAQDRFQLSTNHEEAIDALASMVNALWLEIPSREALTGSSPKYHGRHLIKKLADGRYQYETSVSIDAGDRQVLISELRKLNQEVDEVARQEIARREAVDAFSQEASAA